MREYVITEPVCSEEAKPPRLYPFFENAAHAIRIGLHHAAATLSRFRARYRAVRAAPGGTDFAGVTFAASDASRASSAAIASLASGSRAKTPSVSPVTISTTLY